MTKPHPSQQTHEWDDDQLRFLAAAGSILVASLDYEEVLGDIARLAVTLLADWCAISVIQPDGLRRVAVACASPADEPVAEALRRTRPSPEAMVLARRAISLEQTLLIDKVGDDEYRDIERDPEYLRLMQQLGPRSSLVVPLAVRAETRGAISLTLTTPGRRFTPALVALAEELCRRTALAVDNALLMRAAQRRLSELTTVQRVAQAISSDLRLDQICQTVVDQIHRAFDYQLISIYLIQGDTFFLQSVVGYDSVISSFPITHGTSGRVARSGEAVFVRDAAEDPDFMFAMPDICQSIIVPLRYSGGPALGILAVESNGAPQLSDDDLALLSLLADQISVAVVNARLFASVEDSARRFSSLVESAGSVIVCLTPELRITEFNREAERIYGVTRAEVMGTSYHERCTTPDLWDSLVAHARTALAGQRATFESTWQIATGEECTFVWIISCRHDTSGAPTELMLVGQDITARRRADDERLAIERKLQETQRLESLGVLAGGIAHDFNNLLTAIIGNAGLLQLDLAPSSEAYRSAVEIETVAQRASELVRHMLVYAGRGHILRQPIDLNTLVAEMIVMLRFSIRKDAAIHQHLATNLPLIEADAAQVRQVVMNLIVNAAEALGPAGGMIQITTEIRHIGHDYLSGTYGFVEVGEGRYVVLTVQDTGIGMGQATRARIFDPFFTTKFTGRGLGLAAALGIMRSHNGAMRVESAVGKGSTFSALFPALLTDHLDEQTPHSLRQPALVRAGMQTTVLLIDDEESMRQIATRILERGGYKVILADNGESGLQMFHRYHRQLAFVLLDVTMPHMDGIQTMHRLRAISPTMPVVLMSGYSAENLNQQLVDAQPTAFVQKPFSLHDLLAIVGPA